MIPEECSLAVRDGVVCVVGASGDVSPDRDETGVYANDTQYLREFSVRATDRNAPESGWDLLERQAGPDGVTIALIGGAPGEGRGDARRFLLKKIVELKDDTVTIKTTLRNNTPEDRVVDVEVTAESAFRHVFECPGFFSAHDPVERDVIAETSENEARLAATAPDGVTRSATVRTNVAQRDHPAIDDDAEIDGVVESDGDVAWASVERTVQIPPGESASVVATAELRPERDAGEVGADGDADPSVSSPTHPDLFDAAAETLRALVLPEGVPAAGAPRFVAPFGRDVLLVGFQTLPFAPELTESVLTYLAGEQATEKDLDTLAELGKIPHEGRRGDLPALGRSIRSPYYGTVDATPLFAALVAAYGKWAGDDAVTDVLYDTAVDAIEWTLSAADEDGVIWYEPHNHEHGLTHQGWKDSASAIAYPDGTAAVPPIALAEVQGYAYRALRGVSDLAEARGDDDLVDRLDDRATRLREAFDREFWLPEEGCYALALDADGAVDAVASNQGHALWSGIVPEGRAADVVDRLLEPDLLTDAGLRTYAASHDAFDPLSYHRGSVWPHDTSLTAMGCARYGHVDAAAALAHRGLATLATTVTADPDRWGFPELLIGLDASDADAGRAPHPDSCEPAAWSAGSAFGFARAALGVDVEDGEPVLNESTRSAASPIEATVHCRGARYAVRRSSDSTVVAHDSGATEGCDASGAIEIPETDYDRQEVTTDG
jgi:glycogen debranching enzyme